MLLNSGFDDGLAHWQGTDRADGFSVVEFEGRKVLLGVKQKQDRQRVVTQSFPAKPGDAYELSVEMCPVGLKGWSGVSLHFYNERGDRIDSTPNWQPSLATGWSKPVVRSRAPAGTVSMHNNAA